MPCGHCPPLVFELCSKIVLAKVIFFCDTRANPSPSAKIKDWPFCQSFILSQSRDLNGTALNGPHGYSLLANSASPPQLGGIRHPGFRPCEQPQAVLTLDPCPRSGPMACRGSNRQRICARPRRIPLKTFLSPGRAIPLRHVKTSFLCTRFRARNDGS